MAVREDIQEIGEETLVKVEVTLDYDFKFVLSKMAIICQT